MRNSCTTVDEFLECLTVELDSGCTAFRNRVHVNINRLAEDEHGTKFSVIIQASAVVQGEDFEYILEFGQKCGFDYADSSDEATGSANAEEIRKKISGVAQSRGLRIMPGILDL